MKNSVMPDASSMLQNHLRNNNNWNPFANSQSQSPKKITRQTIQQPRNFNKIKFTIDHDQRQQPRLNVDFMNDKKVIRREKQNVEQQGLITQKLILDKRFNRNVQVPRNKIRYMSNPRMSDSTSDIAKESYKSNNSKSKNQEKLRSTTNSQLNGELMGLQSSLQIRNISNFENGDMGGSKYVMDKKPTQLSRAESLRSTGRKGRQPLLDQSRYQPIDMNMKNKLPPKPMGNNINMNDTRQLQIQNPYPQGQQSNMDINPWDEMNGFNTPSTNSHTNDQFQCLYLNTQNNQQGPKLKLNMKQNMTPRNMTNIGSPMKRSRDKIGLPPLTIAKKQKKLNLIKYGDDHQNSVESLEDRAKRNLMGMNDDEVDDMDIDIGVNKQNDLLKLPLISRYNTNNQTSLSPGIKKKKHLMIKNNQNSKSGQRLQESDQANQSASSQGDDESKNTNSQRKIVFFRKSSINFAQNQQQQ